MCDGLGDCLPACHRNAISFTDGDAIVMPGPTTEPRFQWPIQLTLVPPRSEFFKGTLVIGADCTAFTVDDFKAKYVRGRAVVIGCPKLDERSRFDKIKTILENNPIDSVEVIRMEVPCCSALTRIVRMAASECGKDVDVREIVIGRDGSVLSGDSQKAGVGLISL